MMLQLIPSILIVLLLGFWMWMFADMRNNTALPPCIITITGGNDPRFDWTATFILLNVFAAIYYYFNVYRSRQR